MREVGEVRARDLHFILVVLMISHGISIVEPTERQHLSLQLDDICIVLELEKLLDIQVSSSSKKKKKKLNK